MGLFSSKAKSTSTSNVISTPLSQVASDNAQTLGVNASGYKSRVNFNMLDEGAIEKAFDFARETFEDVNDSFQDVLDASSAQIATVQDTLNDTKTVYSDATAQIQNAYKTAEGKINLEYAFYGMIIIGGILLMKKVKI